LEQTRDYMGEGHEATLLSMKNLATCYYNNGKIQKSLSCFEQSLELSERFLGEENPFTHKIKAIIEKIRIKEEKH